MSTIQAPSALLELHHKYRENATSAEVAAGTLPDASYCLIYEVAADLRWLQAHTHGAVNTDDFRLRCEAAHAESGSPLLKRSVVAHELAELAMDYCEERYILAASA